MPSTIWRSWLPPTLTFIVIGPTVFTILFFSINRGDGSAPTAFTCNDSWSLSTMTTPAPYAFAQRNSSGVGAFEARDVYRHRPISRQCVPTGSWSEPSSARVLVLPTGHHEVEFGSSTRIPVSVGDVYITAGQSNSLAIGTWSLATAETVTHGTDADAAAWSAGGHMCPEGMLGDLLSNGNVPVAFVMTGIGGQPISAWDDGSLRDRLFGSLRRYGGAAVLWHQGESDAGTDKNVYYEALLQLITDAWAVAQVPWVVARVTPQTMPSQIAVTDVHDYIFSGPDTHTTLQTPAYTDDNVHFTCAGLAVNAQGWYDALVAANLSRA
jgi:hypothetical protein